MVFERLMVINVGEVVELKKTRRKSGDGGQKGGLNC